MKSDDFVKDQATLFGHPTGLYTLFFAEMWERFSFYGMRALLIFYMTKFFLMSDTQAYGVYGAYTALVYMTPFFGGMLADRLLGARKSIVFGGLLMAGGHLLMAHPSELGFYTALALIIAGNGFFKPNISSIVGTLYPADSIKRDGGFTIFYIGINLGAAMSPLLCGYIGETYGWHRGFGLATIGMLVGLAVFVVPNKVSRVMIMVAAVTAAVALFYFHTDNIYNTLVNIFIGVTLIVAGCLAFLALSRGGLPAQAGATTIHNPVGEWATYAGTLLLVPVIALFVSGFSLIRGGESLVLIGPETIAKVASQGKLGGIAAVFLQEISKPAGLVLATTGLLALIYLSRETLKMTKIPRERMLVVMILTFFSVFFWAFFEQAGSSINNFTDRNVDRVREGRVITAAEVGQSITIEPTQEQLGFRNGGTMFTLNQLDALREANKSDNRFTMEWEVSEDNIGMGVATRNNEIPASIFQSINSTYILIFGLVLTVLWTYLAKRGLEPSTPVKFALGLLQVGLGFLALWYGAQTSSDRGMVAMSWLFVGYLLHTLGELCLSPVGLSMITKLTPRQLVSTMMGTWFLASAFSQYLAAIISQFTSVGEGSGEELSIPPPIETVHVYGDVFAFIGLVALGSGLVCLFMAPLLQKWTHVGEASSDEIQDLAER